MLDSIATRSTLMIGENETRMLLKHADRSLRRKWSNPEFIIYRTGVRLEDLHEDEVQAILDLVRESTSATGYSRILGAMQTNEFLGQLCNAKPILNKRSYQYDHVDSPY